ncbi:MAG: Hsp20/alpha crystallin family protein [Hadesarchaea archaeon]|nr:Hsp20/alpha crystallin family protein [Hadesarchaea archaeon]
MSFWEDWERWFRRSPFSRFFREMDRAMEEMFREFSATMPKELFKEQKLPDGTRVRTFGPAVFGYSMTIGPDGKPQVRTFGNVKPGLMYPKPTEHREPLVDVIPGPQVIRVIAELPGVNKEDIDLRVTEDKVSILVDTPDRKYSKEVELPAKVDPKSADASYTNGVLEVVLRKIEKERPGEKVNIK